MSKKQRSEYNVALVYTNAAGAYEGIVTWTSFSNKEEFDKWYTPEVREQQRVVEEGITEKRAIELSRQTPAVCLRAAALHDATGSDGQINPGHLANKLVNILLADILSRKK